MQLANAFESLERIFDVAKRFSERSAAFIEALQRLLFSLLDPADSPLPDLPLPLPARHFDDSQRPLRRALPARGDGPEAELAGATELVQVFQEHNKRVVEAFVGGKSTLGALKESVAHLLESRENGLEGKVERQRLKIRTLKERVESLTAEVEELRLQKRVDEELRRSTAQLSLASNASDSKLAGCSGKCRATIESRNAAVASLAGQVSVLKAAQLDSKRSVKALTTQIRLLQDDFIGLFRTVQESLSREKERPLTVTVVESPAAGPKTEEKPPAEGTSVLERVVLLKEPGIGRIDAADLALVLYTQNLMIGGGTGESLLDQQTGTAG